MEPSKEFFLKSSAVEELLLTFCRDFSLRRPAYTTRRDLLQWL